MNQVQRLSVFKAQTDNVRELNAAWAQLKRSIHVEYLSGNSKGAEVYTRLLALTYCTWSEALFSKLIHTPYGFTLDEIAQIKAEANAKGVTSGWRKSVALAIRRVKGSRSGHLANVKKEVDSLIEIYIEAPSLVRNKIAHGQVVVALNRGNSDINGELTSKLKQLDVVVLDRHKVACQGLADIVEALIESPQKGAMRDYWSVAQSISQHLHDTQSHTLQTKLASLRKKKAYATR